MQIIKNSRYIQPICLIILGLISRFVFIWHPAEIVFDEVHFGKFVNGYLTGNYFFDIHPPLGKLILALGAIIGGFNPEFAFNTIGENYPDSSYIFLRLFPNLFGALIPVCIYYFVLSIKGSKVCASFAGLAILLENAILTQSHFILLDSFFIFFGFSGLTLYFFYRQYPYRIYYLFGAGLLLAMSVSIKWTAVSFLGLAWIISYIDLEKIKFDIKKTTKIITCLILIPFAIYFLIFSLHFALLDKSGPGDAFMTPQFKKTLEGSDTNNDNSINASSNIEKFIELNKTMFFTNQGISAEHPFASRFYLWPVMVKPIYYWYKNDTNNRSLRIYLFGNPIIWFASIAAFILGIFLWYPENRETKWILYSGWIINMIPFMNIKRPLFLYHYFPAFIFSIIVTSFFITNKINYSSRKSAIILGSIIFVFLIGFLYIAPLTYGLSLSSDSFDMRFWLNLWK